MAQRDALIKPEQSVLLSCSLDGCGIPSSLYPLDQQLLTEYVRVVGSVLELNIVENVSVYNIPYPILLAHNVSI